MDMLISLVTDLDWAVATDELPQDAEALDINTWLEYTQGLDRDNTITPEQERWAADLFAEKLGEVPFISGEDVPVSLYRDKTGEWACNAFWVCMCDDEFVHPHTEPVCPHCGADRFECPDADIDSIRLFAGMFDPELIAQFNELVKDLRHGGEL